MRTWMNLVSRGVSPSLMQPPPMRRSALFESSRNVLLEFAGDQSRQLSKVVRSLQSKLGNLRARW